MTKIEFMKAYNINILAEFDMIKDIFDIKKINKQLENCSLLIDLIFYTDDFSYLKNEKFPLVYNKGNTCCVVLKKNISEYLFCFFDKPENKSMIDIYDFSKILDTKISIIE